MARGAQRAQYPLIKEYAQKLQNCNTEAPIIYLLFKRYSLVKGYWALWVVFGLLVMSLAAATTGS